MRYRLRIPMMIITGLIGVLSIVQSSANESSPEQILPPIMTEDVKPADSSTVTLTSPRGLAYDAEGMLYIADAGNGGDVPTQGERGQSGFGGGSGKLVAVSPELELRVLLYGLPSTDIGGNITGVNSVTLTETTIWLTLGEAARPDLTDSPQGAFSSALIAVNRNTMRVEQIIDLYDYEAEINPDGGIIRSNPLDVAIAANGIYIADAGANAVFRWTPAFGLSTFATWDQNDTPTSVAIAPNSDILIGFLFPHPHNIRSARIERYDINGNLLETIPNLTAIVDLLVTDDGAIYAVQFGTYTTVQARWQPESGKVIRIIDGTVSVIADDLNFPYGIAVSPTGLITISVNSFYSEFGTGEIQFITP